MVLSCSCFLLTLKGGFGGGMWARIVTGGYVGILIRIQSPTLNKRAKFTQVAEREMLGNGA